MRQHTNSLLACLVLIFVLSCNQGSDRFNTTRSISDKSADNADSTAAPPFSTEVARKFIRTADLKFKVNNVVQSTYAIESIVSSHGGFIAYTNLSSNIDNTSVIAISPDSSLETTYYNTTNAITIRVPNSQLDTTLNSIAKEIAFLNYRIIRADDVSLQLTANQLAQKRLQETSNRLVRAVDAHGQKLTETVAAESALESKDVQNDEAKLSDLSLSDQVAYSTVSLSIYEKQAIRRELTANVNNIQAYEPSFGYKLLASLKAGWQMFAMLLITITRLWALLLFAVLAYFLYKALKGMPRRSGLV